MKVFGILLSALAIASALDVKRGLAVFPGSGTSSLGRITGGDEVIPNSIPYQVALFLTTAQGTSFCGGSIIGSEWILTAAHCVDGVSEVRALLGAHLVREDEADRVEVIVTKTNFFIHEKWDSAQIRNDIALIRIPAIEFNERIQPINLPRASDANNSFEGAPSVASGWGKSSDSATSITDALRYIDVNVMKMSSCKTKMLFLPQDSNICIDGKNGRSICNGDSGGPLAVIEADGSRTLVGASSFVLSFGCEKGFPAAFVRITSYLDWIVAKTGIQLRL